MINENSLDDDIHAFLEHFGVKGMKWGQRRARRYEKLGRRAQRTIDRTNRLAEGRASISDRLGAQAFTRRGAHRVLQRGANEQAMLQSRIASGKIKVNKRNSAYLTMVKNLNYHDRVGDPKAKLDGGQKAALGYLAVVGGLALTSAVYSRTRY